jgi:hypothetical protein
MSDVCILKLYSFNFHFNVTRVCVQASLLGSSLYIFQLIFYIHFLPNVSRNYSQILIITFFSAKRFARREVHGNRTRLYKLPRIDYHQI